MEAVGTLIGALIKLAFSLLSLTLKIFIKVFQYIFGKKGAYGSAEWSSGPSRWNLVSRRNTGLVIDGRKSISEENSFRHLLLAAPSGAGKTTKYVIPNVLNATSSIVVTDPSGEIFHSTAGYLQSQGFKIKVINAENLSESLQFNPLHRASSHTEIMKVCEALMQTAHSEQNADQQFWNSGAISLLNVLIRCVKRDQPCYQNLYNIRYILNNFGTDGSGILNYISKYADEATKVEWQGVLSADDKVILGAVATARNALHKFADPTLCKLTATETLYFESLRKEKTALYIIIPEEQIPYYSFFLSILYMQLFEFSMKLPKEGEPYLPINFLLDEFGNMGKIPDMASIATTIRRRKCSLSLIVQDLFQIEKNYGKNDSQIIINGSCASKLFYPGLSSDSCERIEKMLGKETLNHKEWGSEKQYEMSRSLMTSDEIRRLPDNQALFVHFNKKPIKLRVKPYFKNRELLRRSRFPIPNLQYPLISELKFVELEKEEKESSLDFTH